MRAHLLLPVCLSALFAGQVSSAQDAAGCKDSPLVSRFPSCSISSCVEKADESHDFIMGSGKPAKRIEGRYQMLSYHCPNTVSKAQLVRNIHTAVQNAGYTFDYDSGDYGDFTVHLGKTWITEEISPDHYTQTISVETELKQDVVASPPPPNGLPFGGQAAVKPTPDEPGCKDSPLVSRFPGCSISSCAEKADEAKDLTMGSGKPAKRIEGRYQMLSYHCPNTVSKAQLVRNIHTAVQSAGYVFDYDSGDYGDFTVHLGKTWIAEEISPDHYTQTIMVETQLSQDVVASAAALQSGLATSGHTVVNGILFDTGKAEVKAESAPALQEVARLLKQDATLKLYVVGHTDNVGVLAANIELSRQRAAAVAQVLTTQYGVAANRLEAYGDGPYAPLASNDTEDGRSLNRRVELVKR